MESLAKISLLHPESAKQSAQAENLVQNIARKIFCFFKTALSEPDLNYEKFVRLESKPNRYEMNRNRYL